MNNIYIFGSMNTDLVINCPREIASGETIRGSGFLINRGGKGANQAVACGRLGGRTGNVYMGGCVGDDDFGKSQIAGLAENGVRTAETLGESELSGAYALFGLKYPYTLYRH